MATELISQGVGKPPIIRDLTAKYGEAKTGRWAKAPHVPDRCKFCPLIDIKPAIGFLVENGWRYGYCAQHQDGRYDHESKK